MQDDRRVSIDLEAANNDAPRPSRTGRLITADIRDMIAKMYRGEVYSMIQWRDRWKKVGDTCEAIAKGLTGVSSILAFASSAIRDTKTADILSFSSGTVGTIGLVLLAYSSYAIRESKQRTTEINGVLHTLGVTPLPNIAEIDDDIQSR